MLGRGGDRVSLGMVIFLVRNLVAFVGPTGAVCIRQVGGKSRQAVRGLPALGVRRYLLCRARDK